MTAFTLTELCDLHRGSVSRRAFVKSAYGLPYPRWREFVRGTRDVPKSVLQRIFAAHRSACPHLAAAVRIGADLWPLPFAEMPPKPRRVPAGD